MNLDLRVPAPPIPTRYAIRRTKKCCTVCNCGLPLHGSFGACEAEAALNSAHVLVRLFGECKGEDLSLVSGSNAQAISGTRTVCGKILARCAK